MRLFSNSILSWHDTLYAFNAARLYPGRWYNYYFYKIEDIKPIRLNTYSPLEFLQENCQYYCYDKYYRDKRLEQYGNSFELVTLSGKKNNFLEENYAYIPRVAKRGDFIVFHNPSTSNLSKPFLPQPQPQLV